MTENDRPGLNRRQEVHIHEEGRREACRLCSYMTDKEWEAHKAMHDVLIIIHETITPVVIIERERRPAGGRAKAGN